MLELANTFHRSLDRLTNAEQMATKTVVFDYMADPSRPGLSAHRIDRARDKGFWTIRVNRDLRIVVYKQHQKSVFCYVAHHDDAYSWAARRRFEVHPVTGAAQIIELVEVVREEVRTVAREATRASVLANEDQDYLLSLGVPATYLELVQQVDEDGLLELLPRLPEEAQEALMAIATGERPEPRPVIQTSAEADPFTHPDALRRFWVASDEQMVAQALEKPWAEWLVFLHPSQRAAVEKNVIGPARISGSAGTGKSVVAMHRAAHLARETQSGRILLTTFSKVLSARLSEGMDTLLGFSSEVRQKVEVIHLHAYAHSHASRLKPLAIADDRAIDDLIEQARHDLDATITNEFLRAEWDAVVDYWGIRSFDEYKGIARTGRGAAISVGLRRRLWDVFERVQRQLAAKELHTFGEVCDRLRQRIEEDGARPFTHVVVDEAQDLGPRELRLVAALAPPGPRSLTFAGDVGQRIFRWPFSWLSAGIDVRGRSHRLKVNYRTTTEIRQFSDRLLPARLTEVDGEAEERGVVSLLSGPKPDLKGSTDLAGEVQILANWLSGLRERGIAPSEIAIFARTRRVLQERAAPALKRADMSSIWLVPDKTHEGGNVVLGTLHSAKGLEFRAVAIVACDDSQVPLQVALDLMKEPDEKRLTQERELSLLYVGCTRARDQLLITWSGNPSRFLDAAM
ncbi:UvrD-helicase domain-containing protein [Bradyrhizobium sp. ISRA464]|uniref:UvrD-helicase domain-containing protein n=1 Tax=Bradyrhizobium sp. ISRA464 TaxID=2866200 RepID=UPI00247AB3D5|nr:UvrD-helicase domain-containing protein [Bradyrhizobium sp. ISRA464]WGS25793.1 AAA family ATPase [Bradyrhizobium sp. ISRA464]